MGAGNEAVISVSKICELPRTHSRYYQFLFARVFLASEIKKKKKSYLAISRCKDMKRKQVCPFPQINS